MYSNTTMLDADELVTLCLAGLTVLASLTVFVLVVLLSILDRRDFRAYWKPGLICGGLLLLLLLPNFAFDLAYFDAQVAAENADMAGDPLFEQMLWVIKLGAIAIQSVFFPAWCMLAFIVAASEWRRVREGVMPYMTGEGRRDPTGVWIGTGFGVVFGVVTTGVFWAIDVEESDVIKQMLADYPGAQDAPLLVLLPVTLLFASVYAVYEEVQFRGALQGFLTRVWPGRFGAGCANLLVAVIFACAHLLNTNAPTTKFLQILVLGLVLGWLTRRRCLEAAIAGHVSMNITVVLLELLVAGP